MANEPKMKIGIGADTGDFDKGAKKVKQEMKDLSKVSNDAFASIGAALGVDVNKIQQFSSALQGLGAKLGQTGQTGTSAFGAIGKSVSAVGAGIAGLGLAAAIAAFKQLNAEADAFEATIQGGVIKAQTDAYLSTFRQALRDQSGVGEQAAGFRQTVKMAAATLAGAFQSGFDFDRMKEANTLGERAKEIATELYNLDLKRKEVSVQISQLDAQIAQKREVISDTTRSAGERAKALADAQGLIKQKMDLQLPLAEKQRDLLIEYNGLASTTIKDYDAEIAAKINVNNLIQQEAAEQRGLLRQQKQINAELQKTNELNNKKRGDNVEGITSGPILGNTVTVPTTLIAPKQEEIREFKEHIVADLGGGLTLAIAIDPEGVERIRDITNEVVSLTQNMAVSVGEALGQLAGNLINGEDPWGQFANAAISSLGEMAVNVGEMAISTGVATLGIKAALESLNGYVAIAAGIALVALGTAVKTGLANIASGGSYSSSVSSYSGSSSSVANNFEQRDVYVKVTGTLRADGDQLLAVINNTDNKNQYTT